MKKLIGFSVLVVAFLALAGCVRTDIVVKLNPDGSGTVTETVLMSKAAAEQMRETLKSMPQEDKAAAAGPVELWNEEDIRAQADDMGKGVKLESMELVQEGDYEGYRAIFSFADVNGLLINEDPGSGIPQEQEQAQEGGEAPRPQKAEQIRFAFVPGDPSTLTIRQPELTADEAEAEPEDEEEAEAEEELSPEAKESQKQMMKAMMKMMLEGMKISISVEVPGEVVSTNATHREGSRITLMDMDFDKLLASQEHWEEFSERNPETVEATKEMLKDVPGMKVETEREVTVRFK